jgi:hypothetical protein
MLGGEVAGKIRGQEPNNRAVPMSADATPVIPSPAAVMVTVPMTMATSRDGLLMATSLVFWWAGAQVSSKCVGGSGGGARLASILGTR